MLCPMCRAAVARYHQLAAADGRPPAPGAARPPRRGDICLCDGCGALLVLDRALRLPTLDELVRVVRSPLWPPLRRARREILWEAKLRERRN